jgi:mono/diheme cytochrome c family protein
VLKIVRQKEHWLSSPTQKRLSLSAEENMWKRVLWIILGMLILVVGGGLGFLALRQPKMVPASNIKVEMTEARIARGKYLFHNLCDCSGCHSERDFSRFDGPEAESGRGKGFTFPPEVGFPGTVTAPNITPDKDTGIGAWTDGEKIRAIREGVGKDGRALFPFMPYPYLRHMADEDVYSLVAYLNTLTPIRNPSTKTKLNFPVNLLIKSAPEPVGSVPPPDRTNKLKYGEYLVTLAGCAECHTPEEKGRIIESKRFSGGRVFRFPGASVVSANITPDPDTGIGKWTEQQFLDKFYQYKEYANNGSPRVGPESFTLMPWLGMSQLPAEDLTAILAYLTSQPAIYNPVEKHPVPVKRGS